MIDPDLVKEFAISQHCHDQPQKIRDISVDQNWVERSKMFAEYYFQVVAIDEVDRQFRASEFDDFQLFLNLNSLHYIEDHYIKANTEVEILKRTVVENCYAKASGTAAAGAGAASTAAMTMSQFLEMQGIQVVKNVYFRVKSKFPKTKLLEILTGLKLAEMADSENILTVDLLDQLFQSKETSLMMMLACYMSNFGAIMTTDGKLLVADSQSYQHNNNNSGLVFTNPQKALGLSRYPIGLVLNKNYLKVLEEWVQMTIEHLTKGASANRS